MREDETILDLIKKVTTLSDRAYDILKWVVIIILPATATLVLAVSGIWGLSYGDRIAATITAIDAFLGAIIGISAINYNKK